MIRVANSNENTPLPILLSAFTGAFSFNSRLDVSED